MGVIRTLRLEKYRLRENKWLTAAASGNQTLVSPWYSPRRTVILSTHSTRQARLTCHSGSEAIAQAFFLYSQKLGLDLISAHLRDCVCILSGHATRIAETTPLTTKTEHYAHTFDPAWGRQMRTRGKARLSLKGTHSSNVLAQRMTRIDQSG